MAPQAPWKGSFVQEGAVAPSFPLSCPGSEIDLRAKARSSSDSCLSKPKPSPLPQSPPARIRYVDPSPLRHSPQDLLHFALSQHGAWRTGRDQNCLWSKLSTVGRTVLQSELLVPS